MANRHLSRSIVMQSLFEMDFRSYADTMAEEVLVRNTEEFAPGMGDFSFMKGLLMNVLSKKAELDTIIEKAAPDWPIDKISVVDRNILRVGLYELLFADRSEVPAKVAINEAIELAKTFGGETSGRFVNGVLGAVYKEIGEPGKDETSKPKKNNKNVPYEQLPLQKLGGAVVYAEQGGDTYLAFVHDIFGHWTLSKGKMEEGENEKNGTIRKVKEELGLDVVIVDSLGENEYVANDPEVGRKRKHVYYFLAEAKYAPLALGSSGGLDDARWFKVDDISDLNFYDDIVPIVTKALTMLAAAKAKR